VRYRAYLVSGGGFSHQHFANHVILCGNVVDQKRANPTGES